MKSLIIDNYDSFTFNLYQLLAEVAEEAGETQLPWVVANDAISYEEIEAYQADLIVLSPGPGRPEVATDFGICAEILARWEKPLLGVCLGFQGIVHAFGGEIVHAPTPMHGRLSPIWHQDSDMFRDIAQGVEVVRYHSLMAADPLPADLQPTAWTEDGILMALRHKERPFWGVQFHPESIKTSSGKQLLRNFWQMALGGEERGERGEGRRETASLTEDRWGREVRGERREGRRETASLTEDRRGREERGESREGRRQTASLTEDRWGREERGERGEGRRETASLTESRGLMPEGETVSAENPQFLQVHWKRIPFVDSTEGLFQACYGGETNVFWLDSSARETEHGRFSMMGRFGDGPGDELLTYQAKSQTVVVQHIEGERRHHQPLLSYLRGHEQAHQLVASDLPFPFPGGWVGYIGYEWKQELGFSTEFESEQPDAGLWFATRVLVIDHEAKCLYAVALANEAEAQQAQAWVEQTLGEIQATLPILSPALGSQPSPVLFSAHLDHEAYLARIAHAQAAIREGETYEICLTNRFHTPYQPDPFALYQHLRAINPAPFSAYLRLEDWSFLSSSPERFLKVSETGQLSTKPIKGTIQRSEDSAQDDLLRQSLLQSEKDQAENLMIVDLLRNDFGRVCEIGSVAVPHLMEIESFATVHQMVSTIQGQLRAGLSFWDVLAACFPGGSITGAPKRRTVELLDQLEGKARGIYTGTIGYWGLNGGGDWNIAIRSLSCGAEGIEIGSGGAITQLSEPEAEFQEMFLKALPLLRAVWATAGHRLPERLPEIKGIAPVLLQKLLQEFVQSTSSAGCNSSSTFTSGSIRVTV